MPRVAQKASLTLKELSLRSVTDKIDSYWCKDFLDKYYGSTHFMYVLGPFDELPPNLIHDIWLCLKSRKFVKKHHGYLLISPFLSSLDLSHSEADFSLLLQLSSQRCFKLTNLNLSHNKLPKDAISRCLPSFTNLTSFSAAYTNITDSQVSIIGLYMAKLVSLDLSYCGHVSDHGLLSLVTGHDSEGGEDVRFGQCQKLSRVLVTGCQLVTALSTQTLLLTLDTLTVIDYPDTGGVVHHLVTKGQLDKTLKLKSLYLGEGCSHETLSLVLATCPHVTHVYTVLGGHMSCSSLLSLLDVKYLQELHVRSEHDQEEDDSEPFCDVMTPVLSRHGDTLVSVNIAEVSHVSVGALCQHCPNLVHLALLWNVSYRVVEDGVNRQWFAKLRTVNIAIRDEGHDNYYPAEMSFLNWLQILCSPSLQSITICQSRNLSDECLQNVLTQNTFQQSEHLELSGCHEVSFDGLEQILEADNSIKSVKLLKCNLVTKRDIQNYQKRIKKWKWDLNLEWS